LDYIWSIYASAGDDTVTNVVVNISWGGSLIDELENKGGKSIVAISDRLMNLAKKGVKIVIAAGNEDSDSSLPNWVQFVFPANIGGFEPAMAKGRILTVSAVKSVQSSTSPFTWTDSWWNKSNYGSKPPDYAEPGVNVTSLWLKKNTANQIMTCSGTSFAAPHLAGVLAREIVNATNFPLTKNGTATDDPITPEDPIGVSKAPITTRDCTP
jgi:subtilisin family serine protease